MFKQVLRAGLLLAILVSIHFPFSVMGSLTTVSVQPYTSKVWGAQETFTINITVNDVIGLYGWEIKLFYDPTVLNCTGASEGPFLKSAGDTFGEFTINNTYNATHGRVRGFSTLKGEIPGANGTGVLLTVIFETRHVGISLLDLEGTLLVDINSNLIPHTVAGGAVEVVKPVRDVAVEAISVSSNTVVDGQVVGIYVTTGNLGNKTETFNVAVYSNETLISSQTVDSLPPKESRVLTFLWNTASITPNATCIIKAEASQVPEETNLANNILVYGAVSVVQGIHDIAVIDVMPASQWAYEGELVNIYVVVANKGDYTETFNVTAYRDDVPIGVQTVESLLYGRTKELTFLWDTAGVESNKTYTIRASAGPVAGETNLADNSLTGDNVTVYPYVALLMTITSVVPCDQLGRPVSSFLAGTVANFEVTLDCTLVGAQNILLTMTVQDARGNTIGVASFQGPVASGTTTFVLGMPIPTTANVGNAHVYANALSDWPHLGGTPYCPEASATFEIRR